MFEIFVKDIDCLRTADSKLSGILSLFGGIEDERQVFSGIRMVGAVGNPIDRKLHAGIGEIVT